MRLAILHTDPRFAVIPSRPHESEARLALVHAPARHQTAPAAVAPYAAVWQPPGVPCPAASTPRKDHV
jgi:hypothetical protein